MRTINTIMAGLLEQARQIYQETNILVKRARQIYQETNILVKGIESINIETGEVVKVTKKNKSKNIF